MMAGDAGGGLAAEHTKLKKAVIATQQALERLETTESVSRRSGGMHQEKPKTA